VSSYIWRLPCQQICINPVSMVGCNTSCDTGLQQITTLFQKSVYRDCVLLFRCAFLLCYDFCEGVLIAWSMQQYVRKLRLLYGINAVWMNKMWHAVSKLLYKNALVISKIETTQQQMLTICCLLFHAHCLWSFTNNQRPNQLVARAKYVIDTAQIHDRCMWFSAKLVPLVNAHTVAACRGREGLGCSCGWALGSRIRDRPVHRGGSDKGGECSPQLYVGCSLWVDWWDLTEQNKIWLWHVTWAGPKRI
jgi:hypothetical protein